MKCDIENDVLREDIDWIINHNTELGKLANSSVMVTGATGLLGSQIVKTLYRYHFTHKANIKIVIMARDERKMREVFGGMLQSENVYPAIRDINEPIAWDFEMDYIIHAANVTSSSYFVTNPVETIWTAVNGTKNVLEFAKRKNVKGLIYLSSLEIYGTPDGQSEFIGETDYGYLDPLSVRSSYSEGKRMAECLCISYTKEYGVPVKIARLSQTFGPGAAYGDSRVFAEFARCAIERRDITLHTEGRTVRSYCYTKDAVNAILYILLKGAVAEAYNVTNMDTAISIRDMARLVCETAGESKIEVVMNLEKDISGFGYNPEMVIKLDSRKLNGLGWQASVGMEEMYERMIRCLRQTIDRRLGL